MQVFVLGLNHKTAPVEVRERLAFSPTRMADALRTWRDPLRREAGIREAAILSTCNRAEFYAVGPPEAAPQLEKFLNEQFLPQSSGASFSLRRAPSLELSSHLYRFEDAESARHLFRVASGLDSLVLGESEILGQVKSALSTARENGAMGSVLDELFRRAIACGKRARTETAIGRGALNVGSAAVELARQIFGPLAGNTVLILGAGKMSSLTAQHLVASGARRILVANRTYERAAELAAMFSDENARDTAQAQVLAGIPRAESSAVTWDEFPQKLVEADIVISSTRAPHLVLTADHVAQAMKARHGRPVFLIDIAVPRDIDPRAHDIDNVFLYDIDDLTAVVESNRSQRAQELSRVEEIIGEEVGSWQSWVRSRGATPVLSALAHHANGVRDAEIETALSQLEHLSDRDRAIVAAMGRAIAGKLSHAPLRYLREAGSEQPDHVEAIRRAFDLPSEDDKNDGGVR
jgi:glutamyl-tRNA reductase